MNIFLRVGQWLEARFPEKISAEEVNTQFIGFKVALDHLRVKDERNDGLAEIVYALDPHLKKIEAELETIKTNMTVKTRIAGSSPTITPFAQHRLPPVQPANSAMGMGRGNQSQG